MGRSVGKIVRSQDFLQLPKEAARLESSCICCERRCRINRTKEETGFCGAETPSRVTKFFITYGEEAFLNPAYMLYFGNCNLRCRYCSNDEFIRPGFSGGQPFQSAELAAVIDQAYQAGQARVLQILGGEPSCSLGSIVELVSRLQSEIPIVWNSNFYFTPEAFAVIRQIADFYVADFKFGNAKCAEHLADAADYFSVITANLKRIPPELLLIRQLPLHGHLDCCTRPILEYLSRELPEVPVSFNELLPNRHSDCRPLTPPEHRQLDELVKQYRIHRVFATLHEEPVSNSGPIPYFSGEILIRKDGSILVQDMAEPIRELLHNLNTTKVRT